MNTFLSYTIHTVLVIFLIFTRMYGQGPLPSIDRNYVIEHTPREAGITDKSQLISKSVSQVNRTIRYFDGLGRPMQQSLFQASPLHGADIILPMQYDDYGRESKRFLPYTAAGNGSYQPNAIDKAYTTSTDHYQFYMNSTNGVVDDPVPYSRTIFEPSPLNRVLKQGGPGSAWQPDEVLANDDKSVVFEYTTNGTNEVFQWQVKDDQCILAAGHYYGANELYVTVTKDEDWTTGNNGTVREYKDKQGRVVLKRSYESGAAHDTYYVYDDFGDLRFVLPPEAITKLGTSLSGIPESNIKTTDATITASTGVFYYCPGVTVTLPPPHTYSPGFEVKPYPLSAEVADEYLFAYKYDSRRRMVEKKVPGAAPVYMVYDSRDRLVLTQDGEHRKTNTWLFTKYDALNRPVLTGTTDISGSRETVQDGVAVFYGTAGNEAMYEVCTGTWKGTSISYDHGYTDQSYPKGIDSVAYLTVTYYDNY
ncbi:MAG: DUF6443 domain-containing protein, partial [Cytophagales bacterium]|nr:DUF6443 domain-containing protein [Cytophagales bacterium]